MLIPTLLALLLSSSTPPPATEVSGFGGPLLGAAQLGDGVAMLTGGRGGLVLDGRWLVGGALSGTPLFLGAGGAPSGRERLSFWQGGVLVERLLLAQGPVHPRIGVLVGGAWVRVESANGVRRGDLAFAAEPNAGVELEVASFLRVGLDLGYRFVGPAAGLRAGQLSGLTGALTLHFGSF